MKRTLMYGLMIFLAIDIFGISGCTRTSDTPPKTGSTSAATSSYWTCPMHPSVHKDGPGACPICGMTLVERTVTTEPSNQSAPVSSEVTLSPSKQILANVATSTAERRSLSMVVNTVGTIAYAEPRFRRVSSRFPGRIERLYVTSEGQSVRKGEPIVTLYSPEAISAQQEFLLALQSIDDSTMLDQSRQKLLRWGFSDEQIAELTESRKTNDVVTVISPLSGVVIKKGVEQGQYVGTGDAMIDIADLSMVWMNGEVYEHDMRWVKPGAEVSVTTDAWPGKSFSGHVSFVSPSLDPSTRTVRYRAELTNTDGALKRDMYVRATLRVAQPPGIVVPSTAVLSTGGGQIVWMRVADGKFERRTVTVGAVTDGYAQIVSGLDAGDVVVTSGGYLIDSESKLQ